MLVQQGCIKLHPTAENTPHHSSLLTAIRTLRLETSKRGRLNAPCYPSSAGSSQRDLDAEYIMRNARLDEAQARSRLLGGISIASDMQMVPPLWQKVKKN